MSYGVGRSMQAVDYHIRGARPSNTHYDKYKATSASGLSSCTWFIDFRYGARSIWIHRLSSGSGVQGFPRVTRLLVTELRDCRTFRDVASDSLRGHGTDSLARSSPPSWWLKLAQAYKTDMIASTTTLVLDELIQAQPQRLEFYDETLLEGGMEGRMKRVNEGDKD
ncbi:hypothetical protein EDD18DRAFT_1104571 [Armillaria luteobubalina]|uniref:Uncharacterized protein n=1 Tax=Armillaria luteobubalina TaxID=153913 RepID=A0AA39Q6V7_9AGAR|nr:hypothetical protein EDD18DRAFT_1104571 [Armillaria luteobubalina]